MEEGLLLSGGGEGKPDEGLLLNGGGGGRPGVAWDGGLFVFLTLGLFFIGGGEGGEEDLLSVAMLATVLSFLAPPGDGEPPWPPSEDGKPP